MNVGIVGAGRSAPATASTGWSESQKERVPAPSVTVVATTYTVERLPDVRDLLDSLARQSVPPKQVIFVAEGGQAIAAAVREHGVQGGLDQLMVVPNDHAPGLSGARNAALKYVTGHVVAFIDDDAVAFPDWVQSIGEALSQWPEAIGVTGRAIPRWQDATADWIPPEFFWLISCSDFAGWSTPRPVRNAWGMNMAFRSEAFGHAEFDEGLGGNRGAVDGAKLGLLGEDTRFSLELRRKTGRPIMFDPRVSVFHKVRQYRLAPRYVRRRAFWEGYTKALLQQEEGDALALGNEYALLRRIATRFLPRVAGEFVRRPGRAARQTRLAVEALSHVALGYAAGRFRPLRRWTIPAFSK